MVIIILFLIFNKGVFMGINKSFITSSLVAMGLLINGCGGNSTTTDNESEAKVSGKSVAIDFSAIVGDQGALVCSENNNTKVYNNLSTSSASGSIADFRFFVSEVMVKLSDGTTEKLILTNNANQYYNETNGSVAILDFEDNTGDCKDRGNDADTYTTVVGNVSMADTTTITGVEFTVGVPIALNHIEFPDIEALNKSSMSWNWAAGRKFTKLEINPVDELNSTRDLFNFHLGSTGCSDSNADGITDECAQPNRVTIVFNDFDPETQKIQIDYAKLLTHVDITNDLGKSKGCMSKLDDPECSYSYGQMFNMIGLDDEGMEGLCLDGNCTEAQQLFSITDK
jgi:uncharacterized repeat protein (TIGR04052 family)